MNVVIDALRGIRSMSVADARMAAAVVAPVCPAGLSAAAGLPSGLVGALLVIGAPALVAVGVLAAGRWQ